MKKNKSISRISKQSEYTIYKGVLSSGEIFSRIKPSDNGSSKRIEYEAYEKAILEYVLNKDVVIERCTILPKITRKWVICNICPGKNSSLYDIYDSKFINNGLLHIKPDKVNIELYFDNELLDKDLFFTKNTYVQFMILLGLKPTQLVEFASLISNNALAKKLYRNSINLSIEDYSEQLVSHLITNWLNQNRMSPLRNNIKNTGNPYETIVQSELIEPLMLLFKDYESSWYKSYYSEDLLLFPVFRKAFLKKDYQYIIQILYDYLGCIKEIYSNDCNILYSRNNRTEKTIFEKTIGISGLILAFPSIYIYLKNKNTIEKKTLYSLIENSKINGLRPYESEYRESGMKSQKRFAIDFIDKCIGINILNSLRSKLQKSQAIF